MLSSRSESNEAKTLNEPAMWECRYFLTELPERFNQKNLTRLGFDVVGVPFPCFDDDVYLFAEQAPASIRQGEETSNIKLRASRQTVKLKTLQKRYKADKRFELWKTEFECGLGNCSSVWGRLAKALSIDSLDQLLSKSSASDVLSTIEAVYPGIKRLPVSKTRWLYGSGNARLEVSTIQFEAKILHSIQFESTELPSVRAIHEQLSGRDLMVHHNYVEAGLEALYGMTANIWDNLNLDNRS